MRFVEATAGATGTGLMVMVGVVEIQELSLIFLTLMVWVPGAIPEKVRPVWKLPASIAY